MSSLVPGETQSEASSSRGRIRPPTTTNDDGSPTESLSVDSERVFRLIEDERHLMAQSLYYSVQDRLQNTDEPSLANDSPGSSKKLPFRPLQNRRQQQERRKLRSSERKDHADARERLQANRAILEKLEERCRLFAKAKQNLDSNADWTLAQTLFGVTTFYRREPDGSLSIKLEGKLKDVPLFDQVAVLREIDLHYLWAPFCSSSLTVSHLDKLDTVGWFVVGLPQFGLMRDGCFRAVGCDSMYEDGSVLLVAQGINDRPGKGAENKHLEPVTETRTTAVASGTTSTSNSSTRGSVRSNESKSSHQSYSDLNAYEEESKIFDVLSNDPILNTLDIPLPPTRTGSGRMTIKTFQASIHIESPTLATTKLVTNIDPNLPLVPQSLIDFLMKRLCGVLLNKLQAAAKKVSKDPVSNRHAIKMREEEDFYKIWLMQKFKGICNHRGWEMTPFTAFDLSDAQLDLANEYVAKKKLKLQPAARLYHSMYEDRLDDFLESPRSVAASEPSLVGRTDDFVEPKVRAISSKDSDEMSDLSKNSASLSSLFWVANPITSYLREVEERTELRKAKEIEKSRGRAASRLKPKSLDELSRSRLEELRTARARRTSGNNAGNVVRSVAKAHATSTTSSTITDANRSHHDWVVFWTKHGWFTRFAVIDILIASLFCLLYMNTTFEDYIRSREGAFWTGRKRDVIALSYMGITGWVHFFLCYVALMYAFSSLKVGKIAGSQAKVFYSQNVHLAVGIASASMVFAGVVKTCVIKSLQWIVWKAHVFYVAAAEGPVPSLPSLPSAIVLPIRVLYNGVLKGLAWIQFLFLESTVVGRIIVAVYNLLAGYILSCCRALNGFIENSIDQYDGTAESIAWRADAFVTTRALFAYSATFLIVLLLAFYVVARYSRFSEFGSSTSPIDDEGIVRSTTSGNLPPSSVQSLKSDSKAGGRNHKETASTSTREIPAEAAENISSTKRLRSLTRSLSPPFHTIDENEELDDVRTQSSSPFEGNPKKRSLKVGIRFRKGSRTASM